MKNCLIYILLTCFLRLPAQEYNYVHYDTKDGLAGSTVYRMCQDKKGYLWFATDNGVSMFDGKKFRNFTTEDGLSDNDVLSIMADSRGRVWMMPFNKAVCFYYEGKIYNSSNDSALKKARFSSWVSDGGQNKKGEVYFLTSEGVFLFKNSGELKQIANYAQLARQYSLKASDFVATNLYKQYPYTMAFYNRNFVFVEKDEKAVFLKKIKSKISPSGITNHFRIDDSLEPIHPEPSLTTSYTNIVAIDNSISIYNTLNGSWLIHKTGRYDRRPFLPGKKVSHCLKDREGNIWFTTMGEGIFRLTSQSMQTFSNGHESFCIEKKNETVYAGYSDGSLHNYKDFKLVKQQQFKPVLAGPPSRRLYAMKGDSAGNIFLGFDKFIGRVNKGIQSFKFLNLPVKSIDIIDKKSLVLATNTFVCRIRSSDFGIIDTILPERGTKVIYDKGMFYIGTLNGLVIMDTAKKFIRRRGNDPLLDKRIVDICKMEDETLWIATNDNGVLSYKNNRVDTIINTRNGLTSNITKCLFLKGHYLWIGTNKGLNKLDVTTKKVVSTYGISDGLSSDVINAVYAEDSITWVCSPAGVTYFKEKDISDSSICILDLLSVKVTNDTTSGRDNLQLSYRNNHISFDYTAISFKSAGEIIYKYKLNGLDDDWNETRLNTLAYPSLPPGDYEFELYAVNKFGKASNAIKVPFSITAPYWKTTWFWVITVLLAISLAWYALNLRYRRLQKRLKEKNSLMNRMTELEQASLRAQMNPHFIFNCLNSIQHFILKGDIRQTNRYISQFGKLIRQTLDNSARANISVAEEIHYLTNYLELEQMRYSSNFRYEIRVDKNIVRDQVYLPSMLLQPFVENAIRHGIRHKLEGIGLVQISIRKEDNNILVSIEDNGVGREAASRYKSQQHIEYQSKGITLTKKRIDILNASHPDKIKTTILDLKDENGQPAGTRILLSFPLPVIEKLS